MTATEDERRHSEIELAGFRSHAASVGLLQLVKELRDAGVLDEAAISRVRDAIIEELALKRPLRADAAEFRARIRVRLDRLLASDM